MTDQEKRELSERIATLAESAGLAASLQCALHVALTGGL